MSELYQNIDEDKNTNITKAITIEEVFTNISKQKDEQISTNFIEQNEITEQEGEEQEGEDQEGEEQEGDEQQDEEQEGEEQEGEEQEAEEQEEQEAEEQEEQEDDEQEDEEQEDEEQEDEEQEDDEQEGEEEQGEEQEGEENTDTNQNKGFIYLVSIDNDPVTYTYSRDNAEKIMWKYAKDLYHDYIPTYKVFYITQKTINSISIVGSYKFSLISYESTYHVIKYTKVYKH